MSGNKREIWIDNIKVIACVLVVLGHLFQSMEKSNLMSDTDIFKWFNNTIYLFHVPLFFICSGYLFQKHSKIDTFQKWMKNVMKKSISLGIPYLVFSALTWVIKDVFSSMVNSKVDNLSDTLLNHPLPPYWYLYSLFFIFIITVTANNKIVLLAYLFLGMLCKILTIVGYTTRVYFVDLTMRNWIWFILGMCLTRGVIEAASGVLGWALFGTFIIGSVLLYNGTFSFSGSDYFLGLLACYAIIAIVYNGFKEGNQLRVFGLLSQYTMPVFLMHTIFAASIRGVLLRLDILNLFIHVIMGLLFSFMGPIVAMIIMETLKPLDFVVYPLRYIKLPK